MSNRENVFDCAPTVFDAIICEAVILHVKDKSRSRYVTLILYK